MSRPAPRDEAELEARLAEPTAAAIAALAACPGDVLVLGASGKMGPSFVRLLLAAAREATRQHGAPARRVHAAARFTDPAVAAALAADGAVVHRADVLEPFTLEALPEVPNLFHLVGHKFGTATDPVPTWAHNVVAATHVTDRFRGVRTVLFSTGNVYPLTPVARGGAHEDDPLAPVGDYAAAVVGRERVFAHAARRFGTPVALLRIFYAHDLRYGVLTDLALRVRDGLPIALGMGHVNTIWQGDANAACVAALPHATAGTPWACNVTGPQAARVRDLAIALGDRLGRAPVLTGEEAPDALLADTTRLTATLGAPALPLATLLDWVADWVQRGGRLLGKPTGFEVRDGRF